MNNHGKTYVVTGAGGFIGGGLYRCPSLSRL